MPECIFSMTTKKKAFYQWYFLWLLVRKINSSFKTLNRWQVLSKESIVFSLLPNWEVAFILFQRSFQSPKEICDECDSSVDIVNGVAITNCCCPAVAFRVDCSPPADLQTAAWKGTLPPDCKLDRVSVQPALAHFPARTQSFLKTSSRKGAGKETL